MKAVKEKEAKWGNRTLSVSLMLLAVFALIAIAAVEFYPASAGAEGIRGMNRSPEQIVSRLKDRLNLTDQQVKAIEPIISDSMAKGRELVNELRQLRQSTDAKIIGILTKEQAVEFQKIRDQRQKRMWKPAGPR
jgi:Spy/CpxP family protein refolding chaperone